VCLCATVRSLSRRRRGLSRERAARCDVLNRPRPHHFERARGAMVTRRTPITAAAMTLRSAHVLAATAAVLLLAAAGYGRDAGKFENIFKNMKYFFLIIIIIIIFDSYYSVLLLDIKLSISLMLRVNVETVTGQVNTDNRKQNRATGTSKKRVVLSYRYVIVIMDIFCMSGVYNKRSRAFVVEHRVGIC